MESTVTKMGMPLAEFIEASNRQVFELINGERRIKLPTVFGHSRALRAAFVALYTHATNHQLGEVYSETTFILPDTYDANGVIGARTPDVMFIAARRLAEYLAQTPDSADRPLAIVPDLVVEVVSPNDSYSELDEKVDAYLADGVRLIWVIDPQRRKVTVHTADAEQPLHLKGDAVLRSDDLLPGFEIPLRSLFV